MRDKVRQVCHEELEPESIKALDHTYGEWTETLAPTCTEEGEERRDCVNCDYYETREVSENGHTYKSTVTKEATASEFGIMTYTCHCGDKYSETIDKLEPEIVGRSVAEWSAESASSIVFRSSASIEDFVEVRINGKVLSRSYYTVSEGSTVVEIKSEYLETLESGEYIIDIVSTTGIAQAKITVASNDGNIMSEYMIYAIGALALLLVLCVVIIKRRRY